MNQKNELKACNNLETGLNPSCLRCACFVSGKRKDEMEKIQKMFKKAKEHGDDKVSIAIQTYEMVDKHIRRLDSDLVTF